LPQVQEEVVNAAYGTAKLIAFGGLARHQLSPGLGIDAHGNRNIEIAWNVILG
jgi:hypothetical protein